MSLNVSENNYIFTDAFKMSFEFRTTEQNGIIMSISESRNSPAVSIELHNGAMRMDMDLGNGTPAPYVSNNLGSDFALCNNQWHNVTALYSNSELTIIVNGITKTWVQSDENSLFDDFEATLYIGGIPGLQYFIINLVTNLKLAVVQKMFFQISIT